ncbi:MAG: sulfite exporter TauE/SafE family protein [Alphaproteobacteria bacterium]|nr:MAG: sulfite exporter TauE/SafE family protein [Alphaproteobacteria bacterium]
MMSLTIIVTAFFASLLTLFSGFGLGTILMPVVAVFFPVTTAVAMTAFVHLLNSLFKLTTLWKYIDWRVTARFGIPAMIATIPGAWLLAKLADLPEIHSYTAFGTTAIITPVKLAVGLLLIFFATLEWLPVLKKINLSARTLPLGGILSGFFGGLSGHQGAFRSAFLIRAGLDKDRFVASNAAIAAVVDITRLAVYGLNITLIMAQVDMRLLAAATIAAFAGVLAGKAGLKKVTISFVQKLVAATLYLLGALLTAGLI